MDLNDQFIEKMKVTEFGPQLDDTTNSNKDAQRICSNIIAEDLLLYKSINGSAMAQDLFEMLDKDFY